MFAKFPIIREGVYNNHDPGEHMYVSECVSILRKVVGAEIT